MLEHVPDPGSVIAACADMTKPGGSLYFSTINRNAKAFAFAIVGAEHLLQLLPAGTHEYARFIKPSELAGWLRDAGLIMENMTGLLYNPITKNYWLDAKDVSVNYMIRASKPE
jgi:2-polyprenyl-6-hydroxyphenyl methylase/3-demethylubiquinone-9 3-methyltransferase